jgi:hypothetical protein
MSRLPFGRSLTEFEPLKDAERKILYAVAVGTPAVIGEGRPEPESQACEVRAEFLRFLALGGDADAPVHEKGIIVQGAWITGTLDLSDAEIGRALIFRNCRFTAAPRLFDANVRGFLSWEGCTLPGLKADRLQCRSGVYLSNGFEAEGEVRFRDAKIGGNLDCSESKFINANGFAINAEGMLVSGAFIFRGVTIMQGTVNLAFARVARLLDDLQSWPQGIVLNGFVYNGFIGPASTRAEERLDWLDKQSPEHSGKAKNPREFRPQPWQQLRKVLRDDGHYEDARRVIIAFEDRKRYCDVIGEVSPQIVAFSARWFRSRMARFFHWLYGKIAGYGYRLGRLIVISVVVWICSSLVFLYGETYNVFVPTGAVNIGIFEKFADESCNPAKTRNVDWIACANLLPAYPAFHSPLYALDVLLPFFNLGQSSHWAPLNPNKAPSSKVRVLAWAMQAVVWFDTLLGWIAGVSFIATVTSVARRSNELW